MFNTLTNSGHFRTSFQIFRFFKIYKDEIRILTQVIVASKYFLLNSINLLFITIRNSGLVLIKKSKQ